VFQDLISDGLKSKPTDCIGVSSDNIFVMSVIAKSTAYLYLKPEIDIGEQLRTKLYDK
jgi:hypothetical protein